MRKTAGECYSNSISEHLITLCLLSCGLEKYTFLFSVPAALPTKHLSCQIISAAYRRQMHHEESNHAAQGESGRQSSLSYPIRL